MTVEAGRAGKAGDGPESSVADAIGAALRSECGDSGSAALDLSWSELGLDSFGLVSIRAAAEQALGHEIEDSDWVAARSPADLIRLAGGPADAVPEPLGSSVSIEESVEIGMPQMAQGGLSESWLMRQLGDMHWRLIASGLGVKPAGIRAADGRRLVPVFARIRFVSNCPLADYREGGTLAFSGSLSRLGAGLFFSRIEAAGEEGRISADLMSSFAGRGSGDSNLDLVREDAPIPQGCGAAILHDMPAFGIGYQECRRAIAEARPIIARAPYEIIPQYDINGVGMLYCAAYPIIADIGQMRASGVPGWAMATSTVERDVFYFGNADPGDSLEWRLHEDQAGDGLSSEASIARAGGATIAWVITRKAKR